MNIRVTALQLARGASEQQADPRFVPGSAAHVHMILRRAHGRAPCGRDSGTANDHDDPNADREAKPTGKRIVKSGTPHAAICSWTCGRWRASCGGRGLLVARPSTGRESPTSISARRAMMLRADFEVRAQSQRGRRRQRAGRARGLACAARQPAGLSLLPKPRVDARQAPGGGWSPGGVEARRSTLRARTMTRAYVGDSPDATGETRLLEGTAAGTGRPGPPTTRPAPS
jgi:hypothetical protein